jgi:DNA polymerase elongation subunit (family B)
MELPVDEVVPSDEELDKAAQAQAQGQQEQMQAMQAAQQQEQDNKLEIEKLKLEGQGQKEQSKLIAEVVKQAIAATLAEHQAKPSPGKKIRYAYDGSGNITGADLE